MVSNLNTILVKKCKPSIVGNLVYQSDLGIDPFVYYFANGLKNRRKYYINISGGIILDLDKNRILQSVEIIIHKKTWAINPNLTLPKAAIKADIQITNPINENKIIDIPIHAFTNNKYEYAFFEWGRNQDKENWVCLSEQCYVLLNDNSLIGVFIYLHD